jgi:aldehyde dehydrogenase (NAD+)
VSVDAASAADIDDAVKAARTAFKHPSWATIGGTARGKLLYKLADLIERDAKVLATIETWDNGKSFTSASGDVGEVVSTFRYYAGWADKINGSVLDVPNKFAYTIKV